LDKQLGDVGTDFLFENDQVKVWNLVLEPGQSSDWHHHENHYMFIVIEPSPLKAEHENGSSGVSDSSAGQVVMGQKDSVHRVTNVGNSRYKNVIVEIKK
jgi:quercetin dioxygenase-like cupin family protein